MTEAIIGNCVVWIDDEAFELCTSLTSIDIPDSVTNIGNRAFYQCTGLTSVTIPDSVEIIGYRAFSDCRSLTSIDIPDSVTNINSNAFDMCTGLQSITVEALVPPTLSNYDRTFYGSTCPIYVPAESVDTYKTTNVWSNYADRIQAIQ